MSEEKDDKKRNHLRLVVNNEKRVTPRKTADDFIPLEDLVASRDDVRPDFYTDIPPWQGKVYILLEKFLLDQGISYGLDPHHGRVIVIPVIHLAPASVDFGAVAQDEALLYVSEDITGKGLCVSLEMVLPFFSDDPIDMEDALLSTPIVQFGTYFLEENPQDGLLDLIYKVTFPAFPPGLTPRVIERLLTVGAYEITETLRVLTENGDTDR